MKKAAEAFPHTLSMETPQALFPVQALNQVMLERLTPLGQLLGLAVLWDVSIPMRLPRVVILRSIFGSWGRVGPQ